MLSTKLKEAAGNGADATLYVDDVFSTYLYTGNGSTQTITNGIDLAGKGGMVWIKDRSASSDQILSDTARGITYYLSSNNTLDQGNAAGAYVASTSSTGFSIGSAANVNASSDNFVSWTFRKAAKFFDVVTYTGTGSARTIAHSLGVAPGMIIVKRTDTTGNWQVYSNGLTSAANSIQLNLTNAQASAPTVWNSTAPTSSVFSVGTDATVNASGGTYVAYLFAHDTSSTGIIQCGSFTTDGSGNATVNLGWEPQYTLLKSSSNTQDWFVVDTMRGDTGTVNGAVAYLAPNTAAVESTTTGYGNVTATGLRYTGLNASYTYIYMAIRMPNKPPTTGTQVYSPVTWTGTGTTQQITANLTPDACLAINRNKTATNANWLFDRLIGVNSQLYTNTTDSEGGDSGKTFTMTGLSNNSGNLNSTVGSAIYVGEFFKRAPGFFDEVCYTGTGVATTQAHNLGVVPEMMIVKSRSAARQWFVYVSSLGNQSILTLQTSDAAGASSNAWNATSPTSSVFTIGTNTNTNESAQTFVAYLFATLAGISKVGSYTGNGTGQAIACGFSVGARFVLIKRTDSTGDWYTFDSARGLTSGSSPYLLLNSTAAEVTGNNGVYASTGGFTLGSTASTTTNINAATYIFLAVA